MNFLSVKNSKNKITEILILKLNFELIIWTYICKNT